MPKFPSSSVSWRWRTRMLQIHHIDTATHLVRIGLLCFDFNALPTHYNQLPSRFRPSKSEHIKTYNIHISPFSISFVPWWQPHLTRNTPFLYLTQERPSERIRATASFLFFFYFVDILFPPQRYHSYFFTQYTSLLFRFYIRSPAMDLLLCVLVALMYSRALLYICSLWKNR